LLDAGVERKLVEKNGAWFTCQGERIGQGRETARQYLKDHPEMTERLDSELRKLLELPPASADQEARSKPSGAEIPAAAAVRSRSA